MTKLRRNLLRGMGDSKRPFLFIAIASAVNLILDLLFTGLLGWGVAGAAWATIIGQAVAVIYAVCYLFKRKEPTMLRRLLVFIFSFLFCANGKSYF